MVTKSQDRRKVRLSRALGIPLTPKAARYLEKRPYAPGEHGRTKRKADSDYAVRLREKQRLREQYGIREKQLRIAFNEARRKDGLTGENLVELLEMRLDALVLRAGFARTTAQARQLVVHRHILVDGQLVDRPSFRVKPGQLIHVKEKSEALEPFQVAAAGGHAMGRTHAGGEGLFELGDDRTRTGKPARRQSLHHPLFGGLADYRLVDRNTLAGIDLAGHSCCCPPSCSG